MQEKNYRIAFLDVYMPEPLALLKAEVPAGFEFVSVKTYDEQEKLDIVADADFILTGWAAVPAPVIDAAPKLKLIQKRGIGYERIDVAYAAKKGIPVAITAGANAIPVAEHAILLMLAAHRRLPLLDSSLRQGRWLKSEARAFCSQIDGKTVGIVGLGHIGREVAKRVRVFNTRVIYYDKVRATPQVEEQLGAEFRPMDELFAEADVISLHLPATPETENLINARTLSLMKPTAIIVNTARGEVIDESALADALASGRIAGAGLDVYWDEPLSSDSPLLRLDNLVATPHIGGSAIENVPQVARHAFANILRVTKGEPLPEADLVRP